MNFDCRQYVPCLRWKQGEYQAALQLSDAAKSVITPLIEVAERGFDFETGVSKKNLDQHLALFVKRVESKWGRQPCFVDLNWIKPAERMVDGRHPVRFVFDELRSQGCKAVPVTGLARDPAYQQAVAQVHSKDKRGLCLRVDIAEAAKLSLKSAIDGLLDKIATPSECDLILDLGAPNFVPIEGFAKAIEALIRRLPYMSNWQTFTLLGTSFPSSMAEIKTSPVSIARNEWSLYKIVARSLAKAKFRVPSFGDYCINYPNILPMDMRLLKPSATIRYATDDAWFIVKGPNVRDNQFGQYRNHCRTVMTSGHYFGADFSAADKYISDCSKGAGSTGNLTTWRWVGTNHHLEVVALAISNFYATSSTR